MSALGHPTGDHAADILAWSRTMVEPRLRKAVDTLPESMRRIAGYHFGWWDPHNQPTAAPAGKSIRPALTLLTATALGGQPTAAAPAAAAVELIHNFALLQDDVMDGDTIRHHRPTAWRVFGANPAILAADALLALAFDILPNTGHPAAVTGQRLLHTAVQRLLDGQAADLAFQQRTDVTLIECIQMAESKTAALIACSCALGASMAGAHPDQIRQLHNFGHHLGLAFQHTDDLLGIWGNPALTGKPIHADLRCRKKTLPIVAALTSNTTAGEQLALLYHREQRLTDTDTAHAAELIDATGARDWSQRQAHELHTKALHELHSVNPNPSTAARLTTLARLIINRRH